MRCSGGDLHNSFYPNFGTKLLDNPDNNYIFGNGNLWVAGINGNNSLLIKSDSDNSKIDTTFKFPHYLYNINEFQFSNLELKRIAFINKDSNINSKTELLTSINYLRENNLDFARKSIDKASFTSDSTLNLNIFILNFIINDLDHADLWNQNFISKYRDFIKSNNLIDCFLAYNHLKNDDITSSINVINETSALNNNEKIQSIEFLNKVSEYRGKSPLFAGILSTILPGSGYIYAGEIKEGISALLVNSLLAFGIYSLFQNDNYGSGILTTLVATPFYLGNIIGSANAASNVNNKFKETIYNDFRYYLKINYYFSLDYLNKLWE